ncbi:TRAP transporter large permease [Marinibaculum pumilum]|uniref:TRAP transporter large permease n=1 Tax=Marinibaculum pumilum TaxID=1766165 RepID=A0ABV7L2U4_9PROT
MDVWLIILIFAAWFALFMLLGQNVATCMFGAGLLGIFLLKGSRVLDGMVATNIFYTTSTFSLSIISLYLLMANFLMRGGVVVDLFQVAYRLSGHRRFPLGVATIFSGGLLGAVSGSGSATAAALSTLASPQLERYGYSKDLAIATAAAAGSLSAIIPPSLIMIFYGSLTQVPIGHMFMGAIVPGLVCISAYIGCLAYLGWREGNRMKIPPATADGGTTTKGEAADDPALATVSGRSLSAFIFVVALMVVVFGGIYGGVVTAGEAGAVGAFASLVGMVVMRRIGWRDFWLSLEDAVKVTAMILVLVMGAEMFGRFLSFSQVPRELVDLVQPFIDQQMLIMLVLLAIFFLFGMVLESAAVMVLLIPIFLPILDSAQVDQLWFGVMACFMISLGLITPPVGLSVYAASTATRHPVERIFRPAFMFALFAALIGVAAMLAVPESITFLPGRIGQ